MKERGKIGMRGERVEVGGEKEERDVKYEREIIEIRGYVR